MPFPIAAVRLVAPLDALPPPLAAWQAQPAGGLSRQLVLLFGIGLLVLVATLVVVLTVILKGRRDVEMPRVTPAEPRPDGTLAILPGRFLVEEDDVDVELRIVRTSPSDREETTIGRDPGPLYRHVQLRAPSVSSRHAKLVCEGRGYTIVNYSRTNPTRVNGESLPERASRRLVEGDRIEIGEVAMTYREK
jgi:pSer/pThr/pTyr-binding forkhead associated (FHA) protein